MTTKPQLRQLPLPSTLSSKQHFHGAIFLRRNFLQFHYFATSMSGKHKLPISDFEAILIEYQMITDFIKKSD